MATRRPSGSRQSVQSRAWPKRALALFVLLIALVYSLVFFTGNRTATPKLGIDLQGGTRITLVPQGEEPTPDQLSQAREILENRVNGMGVSGAEVVSDGKTLVITVPGEDASEARSLGQTSQLLFRPVSTPGQPNTAELPKAMGEMANRWVRLGVITKEQADSSIDTVIQAINTQVQPGTPKMTAPKVDAKPLPEPKDSLEAADRRQEITDALLKDRQSTDPTVQAAASSLIQCSPDSVDPLAGADDPAKPLVTCDPSSGQAYILEPAPLLNGIDDPKGPRLTGEQIDTDRPINGGFNPQNGQMEVSFTFNTEGENTGSQTWADLTSKYLQQQVAITLDSQIISAPVIQSATPFGSATSITGEFSQEEAQDLANNLKYGALPLSFAGEDGEPGGTATSVPATLGTASLKAGLIAGAIGLLLVAIFVLAYYRMLGLISLATLAVSGALVYGSLVLLGRWIGYSLDLSGVAGLIIGIGTTADSFVVFYERVKDEVRNGRTFRSAMHHGWQRAKRTIVTGNMVTLIAAVAIYFLAIGEVKGFAFTLGLTTLFDLTVTFLVTAPLMILASRSKFWAKGSVNGMSKALAAGAANRGFGAKASPKSSRSAAADTPAADTATSDTAAASSESASSAKPASKASVKVEEK